MIFTSSPPVVMHVDINSCFATVEQQANPKLRGRPVAVAAYVEDHGCILAASVEAKRIGITTGMRVRDAKRIFRELVVLAPDPDKYRFVNRALLSVLGSYTSDVSVESIDEMVMSLAGSARLNTELRIVNHESINNKKLSIQDSVFRIQEIEISMKNIAMEIKQRVKAEIGEWLTVSIGIAPNRYLAKIASGLHKPDGLDLISQDTILPILSAMKLEDLCGIKSATANRLRYAGILTPIMMYNATSERLHQALHSIVGNHWWMRLHGYEDGSRYTSFGSSEAEAPFAGGFGGPQQKSFGQSYACGKPYAPQDMQLHQILTQLVMKMGRRLRTAGFVARGVGISTVFTDYSHWHQQHMYKEDFYADSDFYKRAKEMLILAPHTPVRILAVHCYSLQATSVQESLFAEDNRKKHLTQAVDAVHDRWGDYVITPARMLRMNEKVLDRIAFGKVKDLHRVA